ncbi:UTP--glucose-1-phosphate uridylyltransferase isoform X2 [Mercurialis annua]|uniref:UTP--glucose-1-phosphate uridylyltransferase isoform X2 n=1 Tax=Mercurialis annua TaxID=3986 RepID=UPI00215FF134|nr:UTP--glucose-1-phosphate uridylyltransferase isoform X2 [Mercurialis annua]
MTIHSVIIQKLLSTNAQLGRRVAADHFKIYTYGMRNSMAIIDSDKTLICLRNAANFMSHLARDKNARFLFVNTNPLYDEIIEQMTKKIGIYSPRDNIMWKMGGFLTNSFSPKKFRSRNKKVCFGPIQPPDCVVVMDTERKSSVILEAARLQVPIVALVDSNMPYEYFKRITYPVPASDSVQFVYLFCNIITKTFLLEQKKMRALKGDVKEELALSKTESREEVKQIEKSENEGDIGAAMDELLLVPYQNLLPAFDEIKQLLDKLVVVKFNGALGTALGFNGPKSAIEVQNGLTSLDLIVNQIEALNCKYECRIPLILLNTARTHDDTLKVLGKYTESTIDILPFHLGQQLQQESVDKQSSEDKLYPSEDAAGLISLMKSGTLDVLLSQGKEYAHVVSSDSTATLLDPKILNHLAQNRIEYCMEVTPTTSTYMRNNMLTQRQGRFQLSQITQDPSKHETEKFKFIDTRNLWMNLKAIRRLVDTDVSNLCTPKFFEQPIGLIVPQSQLVPLNATSNLLLLQSDMYSFAEGTLVRNTARANPVNPSIDLGPEFEKVSEFLSRFKSIPSTVGLDSLKVTGDVWFGAGVTLKGRVSIVAKPGMRLEIPDGVVLENKEVNDPADI